MLAIAMKTFLRTLKISLVATIASVLAWFLHLPQKVWPDHPQFADFLLAVVLCIVLQFIWTDTPAGPKPANPKNENL